MVLWNVPLPWAWPRSPQTWASCSVASSSAACHSSSPAALDTWTLVEFSDPPCRERVKDVSDAFIIQSRTWISGGKSLSPFLLHGEFQFKYSGIVHHSFICLQRKEWEAWWAREHFLTGTSCDDGVSVAKALLKTDSLCLWLSGSAGRPERLLSPDDWSG